ncbi:hypothetical protein BGX33_008332 [Mortierella sp. NVP41]|nr:hypothetical protein BGX33_008332 [Mortierella sp. NVP41]
MQSSTATSSSLSPSSTSITTTTTTTSTTTTTTTTTTTSTIPPTSSTISTIPTIPTAPTTPPIAPTNPTAPSLPPSLTSTTTTTSSAPSIAPTIPPTSKSSSPSNLPVIVGSIAGVAALIIIIATTIICLRRKRRNNRDLTFDVLQGMNSGGSGGAGAGATSSRARQSQQRYRASALPAPPSGVGAYDDGYDYDNQIGGGGQGGYGHHQGYDDTGYDAYGSPHHAYQNPSIFQEDSMAYSTANAMSSRNRQGYDQNLPEITYRNGNDLIHPSGGATGYYEDDLYSQQLAGDNGWEHQNAAAGGYIGPKGLWIANPTTEKQYQQHQQQQQQQQYQDEVEMMPPSSTMTYEKNSITQYDSDTAVDSSSPRSKFRGHNPQTLPESPRLQQLRGGDLFGQDGGSPTTPTSPRSANAQADTTGADAGAADNAASSSPPATASSPRLMSRAEMRSFEMARHSPGRSSGEGAARSYANDLPSSGRPSVSDRPSMEGSSLNPNKSLRTLRREDWS